MHIIQLSSYFLYGLLLFIFSTNKTEIQENEDNELLMYKSGTVYKEKFVYFSVEEEGNIRLRLSSDEGDADMYIAENNKVPSYEPEKYDLHSATCGEDIIDIPMSFKRPIIIGIYGNSMPELTRYQLMVERTKQGVTAYSDFFEPYSIQNDVKVEEHVREPSETGHKRNGKKETNHKIQLRSLIFGVLEVLASVF